MKYKTVKHYNAKGQLHELTFSCYKMLPLLSKDRTCEWLAESIRSACARHIMDLTAFVFMPNHVHIIVAPKFERYNISTFLKAVKMPTAKKAKEWLVQNDPEYIEKLTCVYSNGMKIFRFWQPGSGYDRNVESRETLAEMVDYIHNNPVRKKLVETPQQWKWSSAAYYYNNGYCPLQITSLA